MVARIRASPVSDKTLGTIGVGIFSALAVLALAGTYREICLSRRRTYSRMRASFFALALLYAVAQLPSEVFRIQGESVGFCGTYSAHLAGGPLLLSCFSFVIVMWLEVLKHHEEAIPCVRALCALVVFGTVAEAVYVIPSCWEFGQEGFELSTAMKVYTWTIATGLMVCSFGMLIAGTRILLRVRRFTATKSAGKYARILRLVLAMLVCSGAFLARSVLLAMLEISREYVQGHLSLFTWTVLNNWMPTSLPLGTMMLIMTRSATQVSKRGSGDGSALVETPEHVPNELAHEVTVGLHGPAQYGDVDIDDYVEGSSDSEPEDEEWGGGVGEPSAAFKYHTAPE